MEESASEPGFDGSRPLATHRGLSHRVLQNYIEVARANYTIRREKNTTCDFREVAWRAVIEMRSKCLSHFFELYDSKFIKTLASRLPSGSFAIAQWGP